MSRYACSVYASPEMATVTQQVKKPLESRRDDRVSVSWTAPSVGIGATERHPSQAKPTSHTAVCKQIDKIT